MFLHTRVITLFVVTSLLSACASHYGAARIVSDPPGAKVYNLRDDTVLGVTPLLIHFKERTSERQTVSLRFEKDGYYNKTAGFWLGLEHPNKQSALEAAERWETKMRKISEQAPQIQ